MIKRLASLLPMIGGSLLVGCATIFSSQPESIEIKSDPPGARFRYGRFSGVTPATIVVPRKELVSEASFSKEGYNEKTFPVKKSVQGITYLGLAYMLVDFLNGNAYEIDPPVINVTLEPTNPLATQVEQMLHAPNIKPAQSSEESKQEVLKTIVGSQDLEEFKFGVVKIIAKPNQGVQKVGTGFIVRMEKEIVYIVTAAHVVTGDPQPEIEFFTKRNVPVRASILGLEGDDEVRGLAVIVVRGLENLPPGLAALSLASTIHLGGGQEIVIIGFPRNAGPWAVIKGTVVSRRGRILDVAAALDEGNSGGPMIQNGKVVGMISGLNRSFGLGVTAASVTDYLDGFGISAQQ